MSSLVYAKYDSNTKQILDPNSQSGTPVVAQVVPPAGEVVSIVISSAAPVDADGRPDGTIYIQTA